MTGEDKMDATAASFLLRWAGDSAQNMSSVTPWARQSWTLCGLSGLVTDFCHGLLSDRCHETLRQIKSRTLVTNSSAIYVGSKLS